MTTAQSGFRPRTKRSPASSWMTWPSLGPLRTWSDAMGGTSRGRCGVVDQTVADIGFYPGVKVVSSNPGDSSSFGRREGQGRLCRDVGDPHAFSTLEDSDEVREDVVGPPPVHQQQVGR